MILRIIGNENLTLEMYIMQLVHLKNIGTKKEIKNENKFKNQGKFIWKKIDEKNLETKFLIKLKIN